MPLTKLLLPMLGGMLLGGGGAALLIGLGGLATVKGWLQWPRLTGLDSLALAGYALAAVLLHELGHMFGGRRAGMRLLMFAAGPVKLVRTPTGLRWSRHSLRHGLLGFVMMLPDPDRPFGPQFRGLIAGGPLASLLCLLAAGLLALPLEGRAEFHAVAFAAFSAFVFAITAIPMRLGGMETDGFQWRDQRRGGPRAELKAVILSLSGQSVSGIRPRDLDGALIARGVALAEQIGDDPAQAALAASPRLFAALHADDRGDSEARDLHMERIAAHARSMAPAPRAQFAPELAYHAARIGELQAARAWWALAAGGISEARTRQRVDAMIAAAEGRADDARAALQRARAQLADTMDPGGAKWSADQLDRIEARLSQTAAAV